MSVTVEDRLAISELVSRYAWASDSRDFKALAELFCEDATFIIEIVATGERVETHGANRIAEWIEQRHRDEFDAGHRRRHLTCNFVLDSCDGLTASARAYVCVLVSIHGTAPHAAAMGWYGDRLRKVDGFWKFDQRIVRLEGRTA